MKTSLVLTCIGPDRPGLVESLARVVAEHDATGSKAGWRTSRASLPECSGSRSTRRVPMPSRAHSGALPTVGSGSP